ncbi:MAG: aldehyde dehydrogenase family protein [Flavobacteriales bacterium]|nr:aldehyde dehydrogenase family protein [Flavobacteriales bacterium]MCB9447580.1 aldehyde dehydrogenase family protein [Flavobacteriales bacterium]
MENQQLIIQAPYSGRVLSEHPLQTPEEIDQMLDRARRFFSDPKSRLPKHKRIDILQKTASLLENQKEDFIRLAAEEGGKPYTDTLVEADRAINSIRLAVAHLMEMRGEEVPMGLTQPSGQRWAFTTREPIGPVVSISAFNHPINLTVHQTIPAIAAGCPVILKPALTTPLTALAFHRLLAEAGLPEDACQIALCNNDAAEQLAIDPRTAYLSFIGSARVGWHLHAHVAPGTRVALEHGGVAPVIVDRSADLPSMIPALCKGGFYHAGQVCVSTQRVYVHKSMLSEITDMLCQQAEKIVVGDPLSEATGIGPLITEAARERVHQWVQEAVTGGGKLHCGGRMLNNGCYEATVISNAPESCKLSREEIFGPVISVYGYDDMDEAIHRANDLPYAFQAAVFSRDVDQALHAASRLNAAAVMINDHTAFRVDWMPFGGRSVSGLGIGGMAQAMEELSQNKLIVFKSPALPA